MVIKKGGLGKQKIDIKRIDVASRRQTTFCKRKNGMLKNGKELSVLTGAEVLVLIISEVGKISHYCSGSMEHMLDKLRISQGQGAGQHASDGIGFASSSSHLLGEGGPSNGHSSDNNDSVREGRRHLENEQIEEMEARLKRFLDEREEEREVRLMSVLDERVSRMEQRIQTRIANEMIKVRRDIEADLKHRRDAKLAKLEARRDKELLKGMARLLKESRQHPRPTPSSD